MNFIQTEQLTQMQTQQMPQQSNIINFKVTFENFEEIRRFSLPSNSTFQQFKDFLVGLISYRLSEKEKVLFYKIEYLDDEDEYVQITTEEEWKEAKNLSIAKTLLRFRISTKDQNKKKKKEKKRKAWEESKDMWKEWGKKQKKFWKEKEKELKKNGKNWKDWCKKHGKDWKAWGENNGHFWKDWGEKNGKEWKDWCEKYGKEWKDWGENFGTKIKDFFTSPENFGFSNPSSSSSPPSSSSSSTSTSKQPETQKQSMNIEDESESSIPKNINGLSEEELIQMAIRESLKPQQKVQHNQPQPQPTQNQQNQQQQQQRIEQPFQFYPNPFPGNN